MNRLMSLISFGWINVVRWKPKGTRIEVLAIGSLLRNVECDDTKKVKVYYLLSSHVLFSESDQDSEQDSEPSVTLAVGHTS
jgi:hypothetical protein